MGSVIDKLTYTKATKELIRQAIAGHGVDVSPVVPFRDYPYLILTINSLGGTVTDSGFYGDETVSGKLSYLEETKNLIRQAIQRKGVTVPIGATFRDYAALIASIVPDSDSGGGDVDDGLVDYNGVMLSDVSPYITEEYPDAAILRLGNTNTYYLVVIGGEWDFVYTDNNIGGEWDSEQNSKNISTSVGSISITYVTTEGGSAWVKRSQDSSTTSGSVELVGGANTVIWATFEIPTEDDGGGEGGGGETGTPVAFLYNGVQLPPLPELDDEKKKKYPYIVIVRTFGVITVSFSAKPAYYNTTRLGGCIDFEVGTEMIQYNWGGNYGGDEDRWVYVATNPTIWSEKSSYTEGVWTNTDIYKDDGTLYLAVSEPVPVYE